MTEAAVKKQSTRKMTEGSIVGHLLSYAIPLIFGNLLQLTYNAADSAIIGKFLGERPLAAVSVANPIMTVVILGVSGITLGSSVIMSRLFGAGDERALKRELSTTILFGFFFSFLVFLTGLFFSRGILVLMAVPSEALPEAVLYLRIIFVGFLFTFQYNVMAAALRSVGDARTPVLFLGISSVLNVCMDLFFIAVLKMGVAGAALATVLAEGISAVLCMVRVYRSVPCLQLARNEFVIDRSLLKQTLAEGSLTALQQAAQPIGKLLIQTVINAQGLTAIGAFNAVSRIDDFACIPSQSIGHSIMTCTAQNRGAGNRRRVRETFHKGILVALCYYPVICCTILLTGRQAVGILTPDGSRSMVDMGASYLSFKAWIYFLPCITNALQGFFRGIERMRITLIGTLIQISIRTLVVWILVPKIGIRGEAVGCLIGWTAMTVFATAVYLRIMRRDPAV